MVDDDLAVGKVLVGLLGQAGIEAVHVVSGERALEAVRQTAFDLVLTDLRMPEMDGLQLLEALKLQAEALPVIMLTAHGSVPAAVQAMKLGAADFMSKPFDRDEVLYSVRKALTAASLGADEPPRRPVERSPLLGGSAAMRECGDLVDRAATSMATVLIRGESGSGKEVAARAIHQRGPRRDGAFVVVNCGALPDQLLESELFGYERGAFTGAVTRKPGRVELAEGGTLMLDEIGDVSAVVQVKLLRLLQEKEYQPLGSTRSSKADVRFIAATHRHLEDMVDAGEFREDLFYRLNVVPIWMPPLRERREDIAALAERFCAELCIANGRDAMELAPDALSALDQMEWPGNVRQLQNFIERLVVFGDESPIRAVDVEREVERDRRGRERQGLGGHRGTAALESASSDSLASRRIEAERDAVREALERSGGNRTVAARLLGVSRRTLYNRLSELEATA